MAHEVTEISGKMFGSWLGSDAPLIDRAEGIRLWDVDGKEYIDATSGAIAVISVGHGRQEVIDAMVGQAQKFSYIQGGRFRHEVADELAAELARFTPGDLNRAFFVSGGSEANESAIKLARAYQLLRGHTDRHIVLSRERSYHGNTLGALSISGFDQRRAPYEPLLLSAPKVREYNHYRDSSGRSPEELGQACANDLERAIQDAGPHRVSAFIAEPIVGAAGAATTPPPGYFERIREICDAYDILFIADEVITGLGRTGTNFGIDHWGVVPDILVTAKGLAGGYAPLGAVLISERVEEVFRDADQPFIHGYTYMSHPVSCAAGLAVLRIIEREGLVENAGKQGSALFEQLEHLKAEHPIIGDIRGKGLLAGIELVRHRDTKEPLDPALGVSTRLVRAALDHGITVYPCQTGPGHSDQFLVSPPLISTPDDIEEIVNKLSLALDDVEESMS
ncbi:MAG: aspartate aminotransferase family protein [Thermomicrobiales bacterium]